MIRVLHFVSIPAIWSGVMNVIMNYYRMIDREQIQFEFLCFLHCATEEESYEKEIQSLGGQVNYVEKPGSSWNSIRQIQEFFKIHANRYTWLHNHEVYLSFFLKPLAEHYGLRHFIIHCHATKYSDNRVAALRNQILCIPISYMKCRRFACSAEAGFFLYGRKRMESGEVFVMQNAIDLDKYCFDQEKRKNLRKQYGLEECFVLGHVGRMERQKNHAFLLKVFQKVHQILPQSRLVLVGDGSLRESLQQETQEYGLLESVLFLGARDDVPDLLQMMDLFVLPSLFEGVGIVLLEAQANGLECIASEFVPKQVSVNGKMPFLPVLDGTSVLLSEKNRQNAADANQKIDHAAEIWANEIVRCSQIARKQESNVQTGMKDSVYDIKTAVHELEQQYQFL